MISIRPLSIAVCFYRPLLSQLHFTPIGSAWSHTESLVKTERHGVCHKSLAPISFQHCGKKCQQRHIIRQIYQYDLEHWSGWRTYQLYHQTYLYIVVNNPPSKPTGKDPFYGQVFRQRWEAIFFYQFLIEQDRRFWHQLFVVALEVNIKQSTSNAVSPVPFKAVQEGPDCVSKHINSIVPDS